jgi:hypothetical protein
MFTESLPEKALLRAAYQRSNQLCSLEVPADDRLRTPARSIEEALNTEQSAPVRKACLEFLTAAAVFYGVSRPPVVLANSDLPDTVGVAHFPSIPADRRVIGLARFHAVCFSNSGGVAA